MNESEAAVVRELIEAAEGKMDAMYDSDLESSWWRPSERWRAARAAARQLPGVGEEAGLS
jgi:hypothetical protein